MAGAPTAARVGASCTRPRDLLADLRRRYPLLRTPVDDAHAITGHTRVASADSQLVTHWHGFAMLCANLAVAAITLTRRDSRRPDDPASRARAVPGIGPAGSASTRQVLQR
jgi:hypothetical protein